MMKVELLDPISQTPCALGEVCGVVGMTYHHNPIAHGTCTIVITCIKKGSARLPFPNSVGSNMKNMANGIALIESFSTICCTPLERKEIGSIPDF
jgi:hypothetical protein